MRVTSEPATKENSVSVKKTVDYNRIRYCSIFYLLGQQFIPRFPFGPYVPYKYMSQQERANIIPFQELTNESTHPFYSIERVEGTRLINRKHNSLAVQKYPNVHSCLLKSQRSTPIPDLRLIDWDNIENLEEAEVCIWRIYSRLGTPERAKAWLDFHNAKGNLQNVSRMSVSKKDETEYMIAHIISVQWSKFNVPFPTRGFLLFNKNDNGRGYSLTCHWDNKGILRVVGMYAPRRLM